MPQHSLRGAPVIARLQPSKANKKRKLPFYFFFILAAFSTGIKRIRALIPFLGKRLYFST